MSEKDMRNVADNAFSLFSYHGGNRSAAEKAFAGAPRPFLDLSTGINPNPYPLPFPPDEAFTRLPSPDEIGSFEQAAANAFFTAGAVIAGSGGHALMSAVDRVLAPKSVGILDFSYSGHKHLFGARAFTAESVDGLADVDLAIIVNPNNPDGRIVPVEKLRALAARLHERGKHLVVDEAFMDAMDPRLSLASNLPDNVLVLRSFGKFYGLAGLRLSFLVLAPEGHSSVLAPDGHSSVLAPDGHSSVLAPDGHSSVLAPDGHSSVLAPDGLEQSLRHALGPWPVSGPAIMIGLKAYRDQDWQQETFLSLNRAAERLDAMLEQAGLLVVGGTPLFRLAAHAKAQDLFRHLGENGILTRPFAEKPHWLRFGLPGSDEEFVRLAEALAAFA